MGTVEEQLEQARKSLLDMTLRNKLLNFREYARSTATVVDEVPGEVYQRLVIDENQMAFRPRNEAPGARLDPVPEHQAVRVDDHGNHACRICEEEREVFSDRERLVEHLASVHSAKLEGEQLAHAIDDVWDLPEIDEAEQRHTDRYLQTPHPDSDLQKRLYHIANRAEALIEDAGYNALHLAIGFLEWERPDDEEPNRAPLILVPVELDRKGARSRFTLRWNGEEVAGNLSLELKLGELGFELPEFDRPEDKQGIRTYLEDVEEAAEQREGWQVKPEIHLGFFDFTKFILHQDLDPQAWDEDQSPAQDPLVRAVLDPEETIENPDGFDEADVDELSPWDVHHVADADPSQTAAIEDVKRGRNLVIEGPPGTGKSQTIVNVIAELLASDKTVLFVSEKRAALDVVKDRLDQVGVGDFCLELHSDKASKSEFLRELERLAHLGDYDPDVPSDAFDRLQHRRDELNAYARALDTPFAKLERTPYKLYGDHEQALRHFEEKDRELPRVPIPEPLEITPIRHEEAKSELETLASRLDVVAPVTEHPWQGTHPGQVLPQDEHEIETQLEEARTGLDALEEALRATRETCHTGPATTLRAARRAIDAASLLENPPPVTERQLRGQAWADPPPEAREIVETLRTLHQLDEDVGQRTEPAHVDRDPPELLVAYRRLSDTWTRWFRPSWYRLRGRIDTLYGGDVPDREQVIEDLEHLIEAGEHRAWLDGHDETAQCLFGTLWEGESTDPDELEAFAEWILAARRALDDNVLSTEAVDIATEPGPHEDVGQAVDEARSAFEAFTAKLDETAENLGLRAETVFDATLHEASLRDLGDWLDRTHSSMDRLDRWARFDQARSSVEATPAAGIVDLVDQDELEPEDLVFAYEGNLADELLHAAFEARPPLASFDGDVHEDKIANFANLDRRSIEVHRDRVLGELVDNNPDLMEGASKSSQVGILFHEFGKQRMHKPIRILLQQAGQLVQRMKPCFMMSPLSVAKYLDPGTLDFDVVVFDEASQVPPEDALGTLLRGDQLVVLGDSKQLPPTRFFDHVVDQRDEDEPWAYSVQDVESILDLCRGAFPTRRLKWHYRSRHESLIAVSNQQFYDNDLNVYPSPVQDPDELGLRFEHLPDTAYDRGSTRVNRKEARHVAQAAVEHYREHPDESLGVGTFSRAQQEAVLEEVERLRKEDPEVDRAFSEETEEPFFVKNLERIQGDERDVIFISVGYGYDEEGNFSHNFGPLNKTGGWRRLNVLITRARRRCVVFANFTADAIDPTATDARGVQSLKVFLEYAENRDLESLREVGETPEDPFALSVLDFLREEGYAVDPRVGCAGFRVDLALQDPEDADRYVLGILTDGPNYHDTLVARSRDRQRGDVLEDRGWRLHRVWSTDWYRNRERAKRSLIEAVEAALAGEAQPEEDEHAREYEQDQPELEALQADATGPTLDDLADPYEPIDQLPRIDPDDGSQIAKAVIAIVRAEAPIHVEHLAQRVKEHSTAERLTPTLKEAIRSAIEQATMKVSIRREGPFLYDEQADEVPVRQRSDEAARIEWIPPEEIDGAIRRVLENQYATPREDLVSKTAHLLGFERTGHRIADVIDERIERGVEGGVLVVSEGRVELA